MLVRRLGIAFVSLALFACDVDAIPEQHTPVPPDRAAHPPFEGSATRDAFLAELSPLPSPALLVVYDVQGPGGLEGTLEVMLRAGAWRRENWTLAMPVAGDRVELRGTTIQTPDAIYVEGPKGRNATQLGIGALADAWVALEPHMRDDVVVGLRRLHDRRARSRSGRVGAAEEVVLGLPCRPERIAAQDVCIWEATGLPLRASGGGFSLEAIRVQPDAPLGESAFVIPADVIPAPDPDPLRADEALLALARGEPAEIGAWLHPGLRLPGPRGGA